MSTQKKRKLRIHFHEKDFQNRAAFRDEWRSSCIAKRFHAQMRVDRLPRTRVSRIYITLLVTSGGQRVIVREIACSASR